jgi:DNA-binding CsgD family transcriptional regulator
MRRHVLLYGLLGGVLVAGLQLIEYRWLVVERSIEIYGGLVAALFAGLGIWLGQRLTRRPDRAVPTTPAAPAAPIASVESVEPVAPTIVVREVVVREVVPTPLPFVRDEERLAALGVTPRELEMLQLIADGLSNREIAERAFVSENTVKTHLSRLFDKLGARRRTQAVQRARELRLIP